ncbi:MAG: hypothetical protein ACRD38_03985 [Nitrososphaerales archaeon]
MENKFENQLKRLRALSDEERMERAKALAKAWGEHEKQKYHCHCHHYITIGPQIL